ncbi:MAG: recombinase family protein [Hymenobacter sp.]
MLLTRLRAGDTLVVWKLDRLGRSLKDLVTLVTGFQEKGIHFVSLHDHLDTTTAQGRLMFNLFASLAEFERDIIRERTQAQGLRPRGPAAGRAGGRKELSKEALIESPGREDPLSAAGQDGGRNRPATRRGPGHHLPLPRPPGRPDRGGGTTTECVGCTCRRYLPAPARSRTRSKTIWSFEGPEGILVGELNAGVPTGKGKLLLPFRGGPHRPITEGEVALLPARS